MRHTDVPLTSGAYPMKGIEVFCPIDQFAQQLERMLTSIDRNQIKPAEGAVHVRRSRPIPQVDVHLPLENW